MPTNKKALNAKAGKLLKFELKLSCFDIIGVTE